MEKVENISFNLPENETITFAWCPPGQYKQFTRGTSLAQYTTERSVNVIFTEGFWISVTPITNGQWTSIMGQEYFPQESISTRMPVYGVDLDLVSSFIDRLNNILNNKVIFSLPNYLQARYACLSRTSDSEPLFWETGHADFRQ